MTWIDYSMLFQVVSRAKRLSANARSLYYAILEEFNGAFFPDEMILGNVYLQNLSGIRSSSSFDSARTALINAKLITHKQQHYRLLFDDAFLKISKVSRKDKERQFGLISCTIKKDKTKKNTARESNVSQKIIDAWYNYGGEKLLHRKLSSMAELENLCGVDAVVKAIIAASESNDYQRFPFVRFKFFKSILLNQMKGANSNGEKKHSVNTDQYAGIDQFD